MFINSLLVEIVVVTVVENVVEAPSKVTIILRDQSGRVVGV